MSYEEFVSLQEGDTIEDKDGIIGKVDSIDVEEGSVWAFWEDRPNGFTQWSHYKDINKY